MWVAANLVAQPACLRDGAREDEERGRGQGFAFTPIIANGNPLHVAAAMHGRHFTAGAHLNVGGLFNAVNQIVGHLGGQRFAAYEHGHLVGKGRQIDRCLSG